MKAYEKIKTLLITTLSHVRNYDLSYFHFSCNYTILSLSAAYVEKNCCLWMGQRSGPDGENQVKLIDP